MKTFLPVMSLGALLLLPTVLQAKIIRTVEKTFAVQPGGRIHAATSGGDIVVTTADVPEVRVTAKEEIRASDEAEADSLLKKLELTLTQSGNEVTATAKYDGGGFLHFGSTPVVVSFTIVVPRNFNADLHTSGGDIAVSQLEGRTTAHTSGGSMKFDHLAGELDGGTSGGDIAWTDGTATAHLSTSGGDIKAARVTGSLDVGTSGGNIILESVAQVTNAGTSGGDVRATLTEAPKQDMALHTSGGNVNVTVVKSAGFVLDAGTSGGSVDASGLTITLEKGGSGQSHLVGAVNGGGPRLKLRTSGGDITVRTN